jgi:nucleotidyltransferase/DNA polymerase involved in DNA repair
MDAFYASVELLRYPMLRAEAVVIGGGRRHQPEPQPDGSLKFARLRDYVGRGVVTTATYAARDYGVHSGMGLMRPQRVRRMRCCCRPTSTATAVTRACSRPRWPSWRR